MTLDLSKPEHREALRWACDVIVQFGPNDCMLLVTHGNPKPSALEERSLRALSSPAESAAIVRALFEGRPADLVDVRVIWHSDRCLFCIDIRGERERSGFAVWDSDVPALILRLLDATDMDSALKALREVGR